MAQSLQNTWDAVWDAVWARTRAGQHTMIVCPGGVATVPSDLKILRVPCDAPLATLGPLDEARQKVEQLLGVDPVVLNPAREHLLHELNAQLLGDFSVRPIDAVFVEECNRLADWAEGHAALLFESIDSADEATTTTLSHILRRANWLRLPLIFTVEQPPQGAIADLLGLLRRTAQNTEQNEQNETDSALIEITPPVSPASTPPPFEWQRLPRDILRVLRAGSVIGTRFEANLVSRLIDEPLGAVLEALQNAADAGAPLADQGQGQFCLPPHALRALQDHMLPSLVTFYHERLGTLLSAQHPQQAEQPHRAEPGAQAADISPQEMLSEPANVPPPSAPYAEMFEPSSRLVHTDSAKPTPQPAQESVPPAGLVPPLEQAHPPTPPPPPHQHEDQARAAAHLHQAGQVEAAAEQYLVAVQKLAARGDVQRAYLLAQQALKPLEELPPSAPRALLQAKLLLEIGRLQWQGAATGSAFTLQQALESLMEAESSLPDTAPPDVRGQLAAVTAGVCCDLGDLDSLQWALDVLTEVSRQLMAAGESRLAARLLNDQAAVQVRLGDPVLATHLLSESRQLFENILSTAPGDRAAVEELADTHHLLARMPLHAGIRPGREEEAYSLSLSHAHEAERTYRLLGQQREVARVWETLGRLELQRGQLEAAQERLAPVLKLQQKMGDMIGLARSTAALADVFAQAGRLEDAAALLANSIAFNLQKGSPLGLAFNRRAFAALTKGIPRTRDPQAEQVQSLGLMQQVEQQLSEAEAVLGRLVLPGELPAESEDRG